MAPLAVDPAALDKAGSEVVTAGEALGSAISTLIAALLGCSGMAGDDPAGIEVGHSYDSSAAKLVQAMLATRNGLCGLGFGVRMSALNYSLAEAQSNISGHGDALPTPALPGPMATVSVPSSVGTGVGAPAGWGWVAPYIGMIWPTADSGRLRAAAAAWTAAGTQFGLAEILGTGAPMGAIRAQQIPEGPAIDQAFTAAYTSTTGIVQQCQKVAAQLTSYAAKVDKVHAAILDLLARICDPMTGIKEVWEFLTDEDEDEIKKIADDIRTVVDQFKSEVEALGRELSSILSEAETILTTMGDYAAKQWDQFLHGTEVGRVIDLIGHFNKNFWGEAGQFVVGLWSISQFRLLVDPIGYAKDLAGMAEGAAPLVGLGPDGAPSVLDSWEKLGKDVLHWEQWKTDPVGAAGASTFDIATLLLPGGPLSKLGSKGRALADAIKGLKPGEIPKPPIPKVDPPAAKPPVEPKPPVSEPKPPPVSEPKPPEPGRPAPAPPGKPPPAPAPHGPVESKPPVGGTPHTGEPKPVAAPPESSRPPVPAPAEHAPAPHPHEPAPGRVPAPAASAPAASAPAGSAPSMPSMPSVPEPPSLPTVPSGGLPGEAPGAGIPHGGEPGGPPSGPPHPADGTPPGPGDGPPHGPADSGPHGPGDGDPHGPREGDPSHPGDPKEPHDPHSKHDGSPPDDPADGHPPTDKPPLDGDPSGPEFTLGNPLDHMSKELLALSEQHLTGSGETVLGPFRHPGGGPSYIDVALQHGASYFDIGDAWNAATPTERLAANQHVLDVAIANGDKVTLSVPFDMVKPNTFTAAEIRYLELHGYRQISDTTWVPPAGEAKK